MFRVKNNKIHLNSVACLHVVGGQEQKHFSPLRTELYFHVYTTT